MFSNEIQELIEKELKNTNYGRILILSKFEELVLNSDFKKDIQIAVVGGFNDEPELLLLKKLGHNMKVTTFGIEDSDDNYFDLNISNNYSKQEYFDLILCGQVLEHIWNISLFVENILKLMNEKTLTFIHCPKSNIHHGHTYYSAGYSKEFLRKIFTNNIAVVDYGELGTPRLYTSIHLLKDWITTREALKGKINFRTWFSFLWNLNNKKPEFTKGLRYVFYKLSYKRFLLNSLLKMLNNNENQDKLVKSESYIFFKLNKGS